MPTTTRSRTTQQSSVLDRDPGLEGLGLGIAPGERGAARLRRTLRWRPGWSMRRLIGLMTAARCGKL
jgi:hypothetical protein